MRELVAGPFPSFTVFDWLLLGAVVAVMAALVIGAWWRWKKPDPVLHVVPCVETENIPSQNNPIPTGGCPTSDLMDEWVEAGVIPQEYVEHILECKTCPQRMEFIQELRSHMKQMGKR